MYVWMQYLSQTSMVFVTDALEKVMDIKPRTWNTCVTKNLWQILIFTLASVFTYFRKWYLSGFIRKNAYIKTQRCFFEHACFFRSTVFYEICSDKNCKYAICNRIYLHRYVFLGFTGYDTVWKPWPIATFISRKIATRAQIGKWNVTVQLFIYWSKMQNTENSFIAVWYISVHQCLIFQER